MIKINSLQKYFNRGKQNEIHVLNDISLDLPERGMVAIFGRSGCGKTTLLNVIGGLDSYLSGSVEIGGERITSDADALRNRHIGYIFQNYNLNTGATCFDNVADALRLCGMSDKKDADEIRTRTMSALSAVGMAQYARRYPDTLSGGQKQRIAIARAIVKSPDIILADEPTGNLDETNTVMIMDILREIAQTRLVLLVTHEANLVDSYCDRVIGITDGRVTSVKDNDISSGYAVKNKNHLYLGEFEKSSAEAGSISVDYYGEPAEGGVKLTIVNDGGKIFLRIDTPGIHIIDEYGETKLHEGVFEKKEQSEIKKKLDLSLLSPFDGKNYGRLFSFFSSFKSGSRILTGKKIRRGKKLLKTSNFLASAYLVCFALVFTILISFCASGIAVYDSVSSGKNLNMFAISRSDADFDQDKLAELLNDPRACIDFIKAEDYMSLSMTGNFIAISTGVFETFSYSTYDAYSSNMYVLPRSLITDAPVIAGSLDDLGEYDLVLSKEGADAILKSATFEYISEYEDLINCDLEGYGYLGTMIDNNKITVAAIVDSGELAAYASPYTIINGFSDSRPLAVFRASDYGIEIGQGKAYLGDRQGAGYLPLTGSEFKINGNSFIAERVASKAGEMNYETWLDYRDIVIPSDGSYYENLEKKYSHLKEYATDQFLCGLDSPWILNYFISGYDETLYLFAGNLEYFAACEYRKQNGAFPSEKLSEEETEKYKSAYYALEEKYSRFYYNYDSQCFYSPTAVFLSDEDYEKAVFGYGETHPAALENYYYDKNSSSYGYVLFHSYDPQATEAFLREQMPEFPPNDLQLNEYKFITPSLTLETAITDNRITIIASLIALGIGMGLMCLCIYFIMRSSMLSKVREIGIYRAIGVSKKNLLFKFAVESTAIALQTLVIGFAFGAYFANSLASGGVTSAQFYFPFWLGALTLTLLIGACILFGILPIAMLLKKTPAQILAKYDI